METLDKVSRSEAYITKICKAIDDGKITSMETVHELVWRQVLVHKNLKVNQVNNIKYCVDVYMNGHTKANCVNSAVDDIIIAGKQN